MAFTPVPNVAMAEVRHLLHGQAIENTLAFTDAFGGTVPDLEQLAVALFEWVVESLYPQLSAEITFREIFVTDLSSATAPTYTYTGGQPLAGGLAEPAVTNNTAFCISFRTAGRGRSSRGRNYIPALNRNQVSGDVVNPAYVNLLLQAYRAMPSTMLNANCSHVVVSRFTNKARRVTGVFNTVQAYTFVDPVIDSQRRRLPGRGQ